MVCVLCVALSLYWCVRVCSFMCVVACSCDLVCGGVCCRCLCVGEWLKGVCACVSCVWVILLCCMVCWFLWLCGVVKCVFGLVCFAVALCCVRWCVGLCCVCPLSDLLCDVVWSGCCVFVRALCS